MKLIAVVSVVALVLSGCSQTTGDATSATSAESKTTVRPVGQRKTAAQKRDACEEAVRGQTNAAMLGSALGMVGGLGGFAGRGGAIAGQVASTGGSMIAQSQAGNARAKMQDCY